VADGFGQWFETLVVVGIGGSALGARTVREALLGPRWNERSSEERDYYPKLYVLDNVDPSTFGDLLEGIDLSKTLFNVISKSGSTAETMAQYLVLRRRVEDALGPDAAPGHFLFTTDPSKGPLRRLAEREGVPSLAIPPNVGGRFSVLSAVGLLPAAVTGIDLKRLLAGAREMRDRCLVDDLADNPAGLLATLLHCADVDHGRNVHVLMPYANRLRAFALWFQQLWAESLGKRRGDGEAAVHVGPTPLPALGATDQHSQVQLFMEGPMDKVVVFLSIDDPGDPVTIPDAHPGLEGADYLAGHSLAELLRAERIATAEALRRRGRPSLTLNLARLDAETLGALFMLFECATVIAGGLYGIDPMDQPGVELGKQLTYGFLGRAGYEAPKLGEAAADAMMTSA
jgi:glucose-6-phosphate isomerase